jgi:hypothetical protein
MTLLRTRVVLYLAADVTLLVLCALHIPSLAERARAPFEAETSDGRIVVHDIVDPAAASDLRPGDLLLRWNDLPITVPSALEFLAERGSIGSNAHVRYSRDGSESVAPVTLIPFSSHSGVVIMILIWLQEAGAPRRRCSTGH